MASLSLSVRNFRGLRSVEWEVPEGMNVVVGPNGSGKSTLLRVFEFLQTLANHSLDRAIHESGGRIGFRNFDAKGASVAFSARVGELAWSVVLPFSGPIPEALFQEALSWQEQPRIRFEAGAVLGAYLDAQTDRKPGVSKAVNYYLDTPVFASQATVAEESHADSLFGRILSARYWSALAYDIAGIRRSGSPADSEIALSVDGANVWSVLRNWRDKRETRARYEFVLAGMRDAFAAQFDDLDFEFTAQQVSGRVYVPGRKESVPFHLFSDGWMTGLLHLCALASSSPRGLFVLDEPENSLHPHAIRSILRSMSSWAASQNLTVVLATHSPVVLNQFKDRSRVFVIEPGLDRTPMPLDEHPNAEWLSHFSVGDAYANEEVGAPQAAE